MMHESEKYRKFLKHALIMSEDNFIYAHKPCRGCGSTAIIVDYIAHCMSVNIETVCTDVLVICPNNNMISYISHDLQRKMYEMGLDIIRKSSTRIISKENCTFFTTSDIHLIRNSLYGRHYERIIVTDYNHTHLYSGVINELQNISDGRIFVEFYP